MNKSFWLLLVLGAIGSICFFAGYGVGRASFDRYEYRTYADHLIRIDKPTGRIWALTETGWKLSPTSTSRHVGD
jgi:hypothetical protein